MRSITLILEFCIFQIYIYYNLKNNLKNDKLTSYSKGRLILSAILFEGVCIYCLATQQYISIAIFDFLSNLVNGFLGIESPAIPLVEDIDIPPNKEDIIKMLDSLKTK